MRLLSSMLLMLLAVAGGCGRKTMPVPPQTVLPGPIDDLRFALDEQGVNLTWSYPPKADIDDFEILRAVVAAADYCAACPIPFANAVTIKVAAPGPEHGAGPAGHYAEALLRPHYRYFYKVRARRGWSVSPDSNVVSFWWDTPLQAPADLRIEAGDQALTLTWQPPRAFLDGRPAAGPFAYQVYRRPDIYIKATDAGRDYPGPSPAARFLPLAEPVTEPVFVDRTVANGKRYHYYVRAVRRYNDTVLVGAASPVAAGVPRDLTPPAPPRDLIAVKSGAGVKLLWEAVMETDLGGYRIYRRSADGQAAVLIGEVTAPATMFIDEQPPAGKGHYYVVTAFDRELPPNESQYSREAGPE